jgi:hypothetical protein
MTGLRVRTEIARIETTEQIAEDRVVPVAPRVAIPTINPVANALVVDQTIGALALRAIREAPTEAGNKTQGASRNSIGMRRTTTILEVKGL